MKYILSLLLCCTFCINLYAQDFQDIEGIDSTGPIDENVAGLFDDNHNPIPTGIYGVLHTFVFITCDLIRTPHSNQPLPEEVEGKTNLEVTTEVGLWNLNYNQARLQMYPNPFVNEIRIVMPKAQEKEVTIIDALGRIVLKKHLTSEENTIQVQHLSKGKYVVDVRADLYQIKENLVKE